MTSAVWPRARARTKLLLAGLLLFASCKRGDEPPDPDSVPRVTLGRKDSATAPLALSALAASQPSARPAAAMSPPVASAVIEFRERAISLAAPPMLPRHLAFGKGFIVHVGKREAAVYDTNNGELLTRAPLKEPRGAIALPAGSVLVASLDASFRFDPGQRRPHKQARLSLLPGFVLEPRRDRQDFLWVLQSRTLQLYSLEANFQIGPSSERSLPGYDGVAFTTLLDGNLLYTTRGGRALVYSLGTGKNQILPLPAEFNPVWRLAAAERIDHAWAVSTTGDVLRVDLASRSRVREPIHTRLAPFDFAATGKYLALVSVQESAGPRQFALTVLSSSGERLWSNDLDAIPVTAGPDWEAGASEGHEVVVGDVPPRVAVGGPNLVQVFDLATGRELFRR